MEMLNEEEHQSILNSLANANEEQADALGFFFTLLAYSNILPEDILSYNKAKDLFEVMAIGVKELVIKYSDYHNLLKFDIICKEDFYEDEGKWEHINSYTPGFHQMNELSHEAEKLYLWEVIYELNKARNFLKCRPWKQTQVMTKEIDFQESLVKAFYLYMGFLAMNGFTPLGLFGLFFKNNVSIDGGNKLIINMKEDNIPGYPNFYVSKRGRVWKRIRDGTWKELRYIKILPEVIYMLD